MRTEFVFFGRRIGMASRGRRRWLVALVYIGMAAIMAGFWFLDHWQGLSVVLLYCTASLANSVFLGGIGFGGLIRPFHDQSRPLIHNPPAVRLLRWGLRPVPKFDEEDNRNDERELHQCDRAHYLAYRALIVGLSMLWLVAIWALLSPHRLDWGPMSSNLMLFGVVMEVLMVALTLPQAILLWTEPDMDEEKAGE